MTWTVEKTIPTLPIPDLEAGIVFYTRLGFTVDRRWPESQPTHAGLILGTCAIMLSQCEPSERAEIYLIVDDVHRCHAALVAGKPRELIAKFGALASGNDCPPPRALMPPAEPKITDYGLCDFSLVDPWGHYWTFGQVIKR